MIPSCTQIYELEGPDAVLKKTLDSKTGFKCSTFGASSVSDPKLAAGNFDGRLQLWDLEQGRAPVWDAQAHASIINAVDGMGGQVSPDAYATVDGHRQPARSHAQPRKARQSQQLSHI